MVLSVEVNVNEIARLGKDFPWVKPSGCPRCGQPLWWHGFVLAYFSCLSEPVSLRRLRCPCCRAVHRLKPAGYWRRFRSTILEITQSVSHRSSQWGQACKPANLSYTYPMARKPRIHYPGAVYHVMLRGNGGADIFFTDADRYRFFLLLQQGIERFGFRVHAYCLMTNHIHLAVQVGDIPLSRIMQNLSFRYTQWINWRTKRQGHLFQGRYKAVLVEEDEYLLQLVAYLHLNPLRAGMVENPADYRWSSHRAYMGAEQITWLACAAVLARFSKKIKPARRLFAEFVLSQKGLGHRKEFHGAGCKDARVFGEDSFLNEVLQQAEEAPLQRPDLAATLKLTSGYFNRDIDDLRLPGQSQSLSLLRAFAAWAVLEYSDATLAELGRWLGRDSSSLSSAVRRLREKAKTNKPLKSDMDALEEQLTKLAALQA